ncbi:sn-glycerol-3-phosphate import ATP-binding protein UgpC [Roseibium sp. TrichSKD4]|uniref:ABC transporter ATP-binding protein n=1 Tax=Roseibium sp. TrichSKD4 TaxID=744980 RepID=UPI0001E563D9|nr:ATP-binding cassette domain-containing protein [Roseibium sp. TrichSKD4]EFO34100.1 sn-glycerol-3-phosphate import ATP-binding protein UgpC [Roseibium sp. TrichSKD4]
MTDQLSVPLAGKAIQLTAVSKIWGDTRAVDQISVEVPEGSFTALLGPSGCGKSTTLRMIAGLETVNGGSIEIDGRNVTTKPSAQRDLSMVFQSYALFPHLSVAENILFGLKVRRVARVERLERLKRVTGLLGLAELLDRKPSQLSGGQQQRVALGRAIIGEKPVCLMDEPLSNLDAKLRHEMRLEIRALQQKLGFTMVYVTHDQVEAITMADQVVLMNGGKIEQAAAPRELYERPASPFAARFIGTPPMNLFSAHAFGALGQAETLQLGLRPENAFLDDKGSILLDVRAVEYLGADVLVDGVLGDAAFQVRLPSTNSTRPGETIRLGFNLENLHVFDRTSGKRRDDLTHEIGVHLHS